MCVCVILKPLSGGAIKRIDWGYRSYRYNTHYKFHPEMENEKKKKRKQNSMFLSIARRGFIDK